MKGPAWVAHEPSSDLGMFMGGVVIQNAMDDFTGWNVSIDPIEEADELLMAVAGPIWADDRALKHMQSGKECGGSIAFVIMGQCSAPSFL